MSETKTCTKCGVEYPATREWFHIGSRYRHGLRSWCKKCCSKNKKYNYKRYRKRSRCNELGISLKEYDRVLTDHCQICGRTTKLIIDHNHKTGQVRGTLCALCNLGIAHFFSDRSGITNLQKAIQYVDKNLSKM